MKQICISVLLLGIIPPAFGLATTIGGGELVNPGIGGEVVQTNACGCDWSDANWVEDGLESTCMMCESASMESACAFGEICDDRKAGNAYGVIVGSTKKLTVSCGKWIPDGKPEAGTGAIRAGYWSPAPSVSCDPITTYKCGAGYYGNPTSESSGCTKCPGYTTDMDGVKPTATNNKYVISSKNPRNSITDCYIMPNSVGSDSTGTFIYTDGCFYKN